MLSCNHVMIISGRLSSRSAVLYRYSRPLDLTQGKVWRVLIQDGSVRPRDIYHDLFGERTICRCNNCIRQLFWSCEYYRCCCSAVLPRLHGSHNHVLCVLSPLWCMQPCIINVSSVQRGAAYLTEGVFEKFLSRRTLISPKTVYSCPRDERKRIYVGKLSPRRGSQKALEERFIKY